jgi:flavin-binding protein dodecin
MVGRKSADNEMFIITNDWHTNVKAAFDHMNQVTLRGGSNDEGAADTLQEQTNLLFKLLWARLAQHMDRVPEAKRQHWVWQFVRKNLSRVAAAMIIFNHAVDDLEWCATDPNECLLRNAFSKYTSFIPLTGTSATSTTEAAKITEGCYLYFDTENLVWVRSGKVSGGRSFAKRHKEHMKGSQLECDKSRLSKFYTCYPSATATVERSRLRRGHFGDLQMYSGLAFSSRPDSPGLRHLQDDKNGIFVWDKDCLSSLSKVKFSGTVALNDKKLHMVAYLCELGYDLMLAPAKNISRSPGFETPLGVF